MTPTTPSEAPLTPASGTETIHEAVRARYAEAALTVLGGEPAEAGNEAACCGDDCCGGSAARDGSDAAADAPTFGALLYDPTARTELPADAVLASLGCGNPTAVAELREGEVVLDLGSGGGIDVLLSAKRVGPTGFAYGVDMTTEMLDLARRNAAEAGVTNVEFLAGQIEALPLADASVDVVISNCVVNLAADKPAVFREIARVLRPGGRIGISDVVAEDHLTEAERLERGSYAGCIAGALSFAEYRAGLAGVGLVDVAVEPTHAVADAMVSAIIRARKPAEARSVVA
jgi:SAM-dependent methyltransferase